jgi:hypothetical protein
VDLFVAVNFQEAVDSVAEVKTADHGWIAEFVVWVLVAASVVGLSLHFVVAVVEVVFVVVLEVAMADSATVSVVESVQVSGVGQILAIDVAAVVVIGSPGFVAVAVVD